MISTLMVYATKYLQLSSQSLGWLLSGYGVSTMISESVLVRVLVPQLGEVNSIRLGLVCFSIQCFVIAFSSSVDGIVLSILFSMGSNLVYPSISSIVSRTVGEDKQGEALGALNGIKALVSITEISRHSCSYCRSHESDRRLRAAFFRAAHGFV
jgi:DHA1 family tetracycline resistance protein-like MFS transporter